MRDGRPLADRLLRRFAAAVALVAIAAAPVGADGPQLVTMDGESVAGLPISIADGKVATADGRSFDLARIRRIDHGRPATEAAAAAAPVRLDLANGDRVYGRIEGSEAGISYLRIETATAGRVLVPFQRIDLLSFRENLLADPLPARDPSGVEDVVYALKDKERSPMLGAVQSFTAEKVAFLWKTAGREGNIPFARLEAIRFHLGEAPAAPEGAVLARFHLVDGTLLSAIDPTLAEGTYRAKLVEGGEVASIPAASVSRIDLSSDRVLFLSDLDPDVVVEHDFLGAPPIYPFQRNRTAGGDPIRIDGRAGSQGIGVHAYSSLTWNLRRRYRTFRTLAAIDPARAGEKGSVVFRVLGDEKVLFQSEVVRPGAKPLSIEVDVEGVRLLRLEVDLAEDLDFGDHAVWLQPMVNK